MPSFWNNEKHLLITKTSKRYSEKTIISTFLQYQEPQSENKTLTSKHKKAKLEATGKITEQFSYKSLRF